MHFSHGAYQPQLHIAKELLTFPDGGLTMKQIQQYLGILNVTKHIRQLPKLLKRIILLREKSKQQLSRNLKR